MIFQRIFASSKSITSFRNFNTKCKWNILFFGTDNFSIESLKRIHFVYKENTLVNKLEVVSNTASKKNEVTKFAEKHNLKIHSWPLSLSSDESFHIGIVVSFGFLIPRRIIDLFPLGMLNVHASLLPRWRGAAPIVYSLMNGDSQTGISIMKIHPHRFDIGDIIHQEEVSINDKILQPELHNTLAKMGAEALVKCVERLPDCLYAAYPQSEENSSYAPKFGPSLAKINWKENTAIQIYNLSRALFGIYQLETMFKSHYLKLKRVYISIGVSKCDTVSKISKSPGHFDFIKDKNLIRVWCKNETTVYFNSVQIKGKREMSALDFKNGYMKNVPTNELFFK